MRLKADKILSVFLWLVALHSFLVGTGLIFLPSSIFRFFGFNSLLERFFTTQGGVFHIAMAICYSMAAYDGKKYFSLIQFSIIVKFIASLFLIPYYFFISSYLLIILSGLSDLLMGIIMFTLLLIHKKSLHWLNNEKPA